MRFVLERVTQPQLEAVSLVQMKLHLRTYASDTTEDDLIEGLITGAREWVEDYTARVLVDSSWRLTLSSNDVLSVATDSNTVTGIDTGVTVNGILLRRSPVIAITSVASVDADNVETVIDAADYQLREAGSKWPRIVGLSASTTYRIVFRAGFAAGLGSPDPTPDVSLVPMVFKQAMKLIVSNFYENREPVNVGNLTTELPLGIKWLLKEQCCNLQMA